MQLPAFASAPSSVAFHRALAEEHMDEAAFLYAQRVRMLAEDDAPWVRVAGVEQRIEAHVDALVVAGRGALQACVAGAIASGDAGGLFVASCVACRRYESAAFVQLLDHVADAEEAALAPLRDALRVELPSDWLPLLIERLAAARPAWVGLLADVGEPAHPAVARALLTALRHRIAVPRVADAIGRGSVDAARPDLWRCLDDDDDDATRAAALLALCRLGDGEAALQAAHAARQQPWALAVVAVSGDAGAMRTLMRVAREGDGDGRAIEALGLLGDPEAFAELLPALERKDVGAAAARSLHWITGAGLFDETFVADPVDEAAMGAAELVAWRARREPPKRADGRPFGETVRTLSRDPQRWQEWLDRHAAAFAAGRRIRGGRPCTARSTMENLADPAGDARIRRAAALELAIRYACPIPFDVALPVAAQHAALTRLRAWADAQAGRAEPGAWTFAGRAR